jgi:site-specific DNA-methyltransferase (adenine-specific)
VVAYYSFVGDVVLDPCMGRGTTGWAALDLERCFVGIERDAAYFARARAELEARAAQGRLW